MAGIVKKLSRRRLIGLAGIFATGLVGATVIPGFSGVQVLESGLFVHSTQGPKLDYPTASVPMKAGRIFGMRYRVQGREPGMPVTLAAHIEMPKPGMLDPLTGKRTRRLVQHQQVRVGRTRFAGYELKTDQDMLKGEWTIAVYHGERKLNSRTYYLHRPKKRDKG